MKKFILLAIGLMGFSFLAGSTQAAENKIASVYQAKCASCHGKEGKGNPSMAKVFKVEPSALDLTTQAIAEKKDEDLSAVTANGKAKMPAYKGKIPQTDIEGLTAYIRTLAPKEEKK